MTEAAPTQPASASTSKSTSASPCAPSLAWLVHSQDSISRSLPPEIDDKPLVRQKRRRTSPEDQKILEEEFKKNPRPDKWTRHEIVQRVALGEKEVQIWFQNRRQNSRRKTLPLTADEVALLNRLNEDSSSQIPSSDGAEERMQGELDNKEKENSATLTQRTAEKEIPGEPSASEARRLHTAGRPVATQSSDDLDAPHSSVVPTAGAVSLQASYETVPTELSSSQVLASSQDSMASSFPRTGYLANRRSASFVQLKAESLSYEQKPEKERSLDRASSLRLSTTSDGAAKVVNPFSPSPSPPRSQPAPPLMAPPPRTGGLRRSHSAAGFADKLKQAEEGLFSRKLQRTMSGRSRDSRAWEFWCDSEARNSLTEKAAQESSGSAADAIGLIRSNSKSAAMRAGEHRKKEMQARREAAAAARRKPGFGRSSTATARLPSETRKAPTGSKATSFKSKAHDEQVEVWEQPNTDSDKENWEPPGNSTHSPRRRPLGSSQSRRPNRTVLGESQTVPSHHASLANMMAREQKSKLSTVSGKGKPRVDDEVAAFMGQSRRGSDESDRSGSAEADMDCIQGLLSLSKGAWA